MIQKSYLIFQLTSKIIKYIFLVTTQNLNNNLLVMYIYNFDVIILSQLYVTCNIYTVNTTYYYYYNTFIYFYKKKCNMYVKMEVVILF